jgi:hypothetical protein
MVGGSLNSSAGGSGSFSQLMPPSDVGASSAVDRTDVDRTEPSPQSSGWLACGEESRDAGTGACIPDQG